MNIKEFKPGQVITRTEPVLIKRKSRYNEDLGMEVDGGYEKSFDLYGIPSNFLGIANGAINIKYGGGQVVLPLHDELNVNWTEGWEEYIELKKEEPKLVENPVDVTRNSDLLKEVAMYGLLIAMMMFGQLYDQMSFSFGMVTSILGLAFAVNFYDYLKSGNRFW